MITILLHVATFVSAIGVLILLGIELGKLIKFIASIDRNKIRAEKEAKERNALSQLIVQAQKKIEEIDAKKKK